MPNSIRFICNLTQWDTMNVLSHLENSDIIRHQINLDSVQNICIPEHGIREFGSQNNFQMKCILDPRKRKLSLKSISNRVSGGPLPSSNFNQSAFELVLERLFVKIIAGESHQNKTLLI